MKKFLMCRFGGIGDALILTGVAKWVKENEKDAHITYACRGKEQVSMLNNLPFLDRVIEIQRFPHPGLGSNCIKCGDGWETLEHAKERYDMVFDFVNSIENNSQHHQLAEKYGDWMATQNSNYVNWADMSLAWANIDPSKTGDEYKRPIYHVTEDERRWAKNQLQAYPRPLIGMSLYASARARSYFNPQELVQEVFDEYKGATVLLWDNDRWLAIREGGMEDAVVQPDIRKSASIVEQMDAIICADTGMSHIAEGVKTHSVTIYSTVPAWTRNKYYGFSHDVQVDIDCAPCFTLHTHCPINRQRALEELSDREKQIMNLSKQNMPPQQAATILHTTPDKLMQEHQAVQAKLDGVASVIPDCIVSVTADMVIDKLGQALSETYYENAMEVQSA